MNPEISIVGPLYNEGPNVLPLIEKVFSAFQARSSAIELILVDDGSNDDTWTRILQGAAADSRIRPVRHLRNAGQSAALFTGLRASTGPVIATLDGDLQNDPADLPRMIGQLSDCDLVCGVREKRMDSWLRRISSRIARAARKLMLGVDFRDTGCALRAFKRPVLHTLPAFNGVHRFLPILAHGGGAVVRETPVTHHARAAGVSKYGVWNRLGRGIFDLIMVRWYLKRQVKAMAPVEIPAAESIRATPASRK